MGLTAHDMNDMGRLAMLAANPQGTTREEIYLAVASLYRVQAPHLNSRERELMQEILRHLTRNVEMAIRIALAERLADDSTAPHELILLLADDSIEVARPIILRSPLLTDRDVLEMIAEANVPVQEAVAARANITEMVTEALSKSDIETVLVALVRNTTAKFSSSTFETLIDKSQHFASMQDPLVHRPDMPPQLAVKMCEWVSDALKQYIVQNYEVSPQTIEKALNQAGKVMHAETAGHSDAPAESAQKLIEKLAASGQLKAGFLLRVLHQGQVDLFDLGFARLLDLPLNESRKAFYEGGTKNVALACRAVGIDRAVFATVFNLSRQARGMPAVVTRGDQADVEAIFNGFTKPQALEQLRAGSLQ